MSTLHTVNKSPFASSSLQSCLNHTIKGDAVLMIEDGVYGASKGSSVSAAVAEKNGEIEIYALKGDLAARGIDEAKLIAGIKVVDYKEFVELVAKHDLANSWL